MKRTSGQYAGENAELTVDDFGNAKVVFSIPEGEARRLAVAAVSSGGEIAVEISLNGHRFRAMGIEARVDTLDVGSRKISGPNVVSFKKLKL